MCKLKIIAVTAVLVLPVWFGSASGAPEPVEAVPTVTVSTTLLGSAVAALAGPRVEVNLLMPPDTCPGHFALTPRQAIRTAESALFLTHGFEPFMRTAGDRFAGVHHQLRVRGNTMLPEVHLRMAAELHDVLAGLLPYIGRNWPPITRPIPRPSGQPRASCASRWPRWRAPRYWRP